MNLYPKSKSGLSTGLALILSIFLISLYSSQNGKILLYKNPELFMENRVEELLKRMTLEEKITLLSGKGFETNPVERLGIPSIRMCDGPVGVRWDKSTCFPSSIGMAASWDTELISRIGWAIAREVKAKGRHMLLGPCININRVPMGGRNFESFGEDPYLTSRLTVSYVKIVQEQGVIATPKHYACNNQEWERHSINVKVDERALREIYLPAFQSAVEEGRAWSIMAAYNKVNGFHCTENNHLLNDILKNEWGFEGFVVSDWGATHSTINAANFGLDLEMPERIYFGEDLLKAVKSVEVKESIIDDKVRRILRVMFLVGLFDGKSNLDRGALDTKEHREIALQAAREGVVLLKNERKILPINIEKMKSIAVIGPNAAINRHGGGGSSAVSPFYSISPLEGLKKKIGNDVEINYSLGCKLEDEISPKELFIDAVTTAKKSDMVIIFTGLSNQFESEGFDRKDLNLPECQNELIEKISEVNKNVVVVLNTGSPVLMNRWIDKVSAVVEAWYPGQEGGNAIADILFGYYNPSGKLPVAFPLRWEDCPAYLTYPGKDGETSYSEGIFVGYRYFDKKNIKTLFPFGHGLSYTTVEYNNIEIFPDAISDDEVVNVKIDLKNSGKIEGAEVVQLYIRDVESSVERPFKELKGFKKVNLKPGETKTISFTLERKAISFYDEIRKDWVAEPGEFEVLIGSSSQDIRLKGKFVLK
ncbi:MAG: glycoside hydrolase family 3 C-terminal domain-containing protein [Acidobacteriota bacterium]